MEKLLTNFLELARSCWWNCSEGFSTPDLEARIDMPNADWMSGFSDSTKLTLTDITFPGSHDAGLHEGKGGFESMGTFFDVKDDTICQFYDVAGQLRAGSRAFDLRIRPHPTSGVLRTYHSESAADTFGIGGWGQDLPSICTQVDDFLKDHNGEIVILRFSHTKQKHGAHNCLANINSDRLYKAPTTNLTNIANVPLSELRGKVIAIFDEKAMEPALPFSKGFHRFTKLKSSPAPQSGLAISGSYAGFSAGVFVNDAQLMREITHHALLTANDHGGMTKIQYDGRVKHDHLFMIYWQLAFKVKAKTVSKVTANSNLTRLEDERGTHHNLDYLLNWFRGKDDMYHATLNKVFSAKKKLVSAVTSTNRKYVRPNWINLDFINDEICSKVIAFNADLLKDVEV